MDADRMGRGERTEEVERGDELSRLRQRVTSLEERNHVLEDRERRVMTLLGTTLPEKIDHDLRNVMNELVLLRKVLEQEEGE